MGNRATVSFAGTNPAAPCAYLHWSGSRCSVEAFLDIVRAAAPESVNPVHITPIAARDAFARAALAFGTSVCVGTYEECDTDNGDNGTYIVDSSLEIVGRQFAEGIDDDDDDEHRAAIVAVTLSNAAAMGDTAYRALQPEAV